jgi:ATP-dependent DNA helicase RecG
MQRFAEGRIKILVATTVIEVGIDVPEATIMVIENAERFGLSQLHQLRGRIGRGVYDSYCILVTKKKIASLIDSKAKLSSDDPDAVSLSRLRVLNRIEDGFLLSEYDLRLRGTGELFGLKQHGISELKIADIIHNLDIMIKARESASALLKTDPLLSAPEHLLLKRQVIKAFGNKMNLGLIR